MSINDLFRSFFGIPPRHGGNSAFGEPFPPRDDEGETEEEELFGFHGFGNMDDIFKHFHGDMMQQMEEIQRQMEDMFDSFGSTDFPALGRGFEEDRQTDNGNLRDKMLKPGEEGGAKGFEIVPYTEKSQPYNTPSIFGRMFNLPNWNPVKPQDKVDIDLDQDVQAGDLSKLFESFEPKKRVNQLEPQTPRTSFRSVSIQKIHKPDGTIEERKTTRDSAGNEETTVTHSHGDKSHSVTTRKTPTGQEEVVEKTFTNAEDYLMPDASLQPPEITNPEQKQSDFSIFRKFFGTSILPDPSRKP